MLSPIFHYLYSIIFLTNKIPNISLLCPTVNQVILYSLIGSLQKKMCHDWTLDELLLFLYQITQAFVDFSIKQITHLDLKPQNILLKAPGQYLVCDFGCSKVVADLAFSKNWLKMSMSKGLGTPQYSAPQILQTNKANKYSDVWSLGVILYKMIYHKSPFSNNRGLSFGNYKTSFDGYKKEIEPIIGILKRMISIQKRPSWRQIRTNIYEILKIQDTTDIITSTSEYKKYIKNLSILGSCFVHHVDRIKNILESQEINYIKTQKYLLLFILKLTEQEGYLNNTDMLFFFQTTKLNIKTDFKTHNQHIYSQIRQIYEDINNLGDKKSKQIKKDQKQILIQESISSIKKNLVKEIKILGQGIKKLPQQVRKKLQKTAQYEFNKIKRIIQFISGQFGNNLNYKKKRQLADLIQYLVYA